VVLSGHSDVVPVDGQAWTSDPWTVTERDGRLYGRGTCDMKGYVALAVWALVEAQRGAWRGRCNWRCPMTRRSAAPARRR
jgi:acetylornithine deacetylase/succinyl-diaminopimelate desuccinylase-like protein